MRSCRTSAAAPQVRVPGTAGAALTEKGRAKDDPANDNGIANDKGAANGNAEARGNAEVRGGAGARSSAGAKGNGEVKGNGAAKSATGQAKSAAPTAAKPKPPEPERPEPKANPGKSPRKRRTTSHAPGLSAGHLADAACDRRAGHARPLLRGRVHAR